MPGIKRMAASSSPTMRPPLASTAPTTAPASPLSRHDHNSPNAAVAAHVSDDVWAKAIHAVKNQKMSLRNAAQLYGVHHMSLHRRLRGRYTTAVAASFDIRALLSDADEAEVLGVLREQFLHEKRITSDDIRFVVRAIASHGGQRALPTEFPPSRWIADFKRAHGFAKLNSYAYPPRGALATGSTRTGSKSDNDDDDDRMDDDRHSVDSSEGNSSSSSAPQFTRPLPPRYIVPSYDDDDRMDNDNRQSPSDDNDNDNDDENEEFGNTTGSSSVSSFESNDSAASQSTGSMASSLLESQSPTDQTSSSLAATHQQHQRDHQRDEHDDEQHKRNYKLSHTVAPETWEQAIAAVEQQGMSLRAAARAYNVHFAALHRRVKKRAQHDAAAAAMAPMEGYFHPDDEAGIVRVVVARAELGVLMAFDELMDLVQRAALRNLPDISVDAARKLMMRFQTRNEHAVRHIVVDWPLPRLGAMSLSSNSSSTGKSSSASSSSHHHSHSKAPALPPTMRVTRAPLSRPSVIVTNTSDLSGSMRSALTASFGSGTASMPSMRMLPLGLTGRSNSAPAVTAAAAPPTGMNLLPSSHSLFLRAPPPPALPPQLTQSSPGATTRISSSNSSSNSSDKGTSSIMFV